MAAEVTGVRERLWAQVAAALVMSHTHWIYGTFICFGGLLIAESQSTAPERLSPAEATLVASIAQAGRVIGCLLSAPLTDRLGVLRVIQLSTPLNLLAWPLLTLAGTRGAMVGGAVLVGILVGLCAFGGRLYISEVSSVHRRATLCYIPTIAIGLSLLACFSLSAAIQWRLAALLCGCLPSAAHFLGATLLPNSPRWLLHRGAPEDRARKAIAFYRGPHADVASELRDIRQSLKGSKNINILRQAKLVFTDWTITKPCLLLLIQYAFDIFCGGLVLAQYAPGIFQTAVASLSPAQCSQLLAALQVCGLLCSATLLRWWGRRVVLMAAGTLAAAGMLTVAAFFYFEETLGGHTWLVLVGVVIGNAASSGGISPISHVICGELLPLSVRPLFGNVLSLYLGGMNLSFLNLFPVLREALGSAGLFTALAGVNVLLVIHARWLLPETRGLSLEQVQERHFSSRRKDTVTTQTKPEAVTDKVTTTDKAEAKWKAHASSGIEALANAMETDGPTAVENSETTRSGDRGVILRVETEMEIETEDTEADQVELETGRTETETEGASSCPLHEPESCTTLCVYYGLNNTEKWTTIHL